MEKYIFIFLIGTTILNLILTLNAKSELEDKIFKQLFFYWISLFGTYLTTMLLSVGETQISFAYFFQFIPTFLMANVLINSRGIKFNWLQYLIAQGFGMLISTGLILINPHNFTLNLIPITISTSLPLLHPIINTLITERKKSNKIEKTLAVVFITGILNHFNYAFFRLAPEASTWGWAISIAQYQCLMVILPLLMVHQNRMYERENLNNAIENLAGTNLKMNIKVEHLYETLNNQISQRNKLLIDLNEQRELNELLIRTVSHDVATPLTVINAYTDLLSSGRIGEQDRPKTFEKIKNNSLAAQAMIARIKDNILSRDSSKIISLREVSMVQIIDDCVAQFESSLQKKNLHVSVHPFSKNLTILADPKIMTEHVFSNIMSNAIKFSSPSSGIDILVADDPSYISVTFKDYGQGISPERLKSEGLGSTIGTQGEQGTGYGLKVTNYFVTQQQGQFHITSHGHGLGTEVTLTFKRFKQS